MYGKQTCDDQFKLSSYACNLPKENSNVYQRYLDKIKMIGRIDPYTIKFQKPELPTKVTTGSVIDYLINFRSPYTGNIIKNSRSMEGYKKFENGFVHSVDGKLLGEEYIVMGKVIHSMRLNESMLRPWIIVRKPGNILCAHCNCIAGISETCSHVSAVLYSLANLHAQCTDRRITVTDIPAYWWQPLKLVKEDIYKQVKDTNNGNATNKFCDSNSVPTREEFCNLLQKIGKDGGDEVILNRICNKATFACKDCRRERLKFTNIQAKRTIKSTTLKPFSNRLKESTKIVPLSHHIMYVESFVCQDNVTLF
ncbi:uncharacterized protein LOC128745553 [Sabethes cyaneus]|uniref:uncharacterized protein LOC128745553 n=1 Tax=Sabethes cyaneus TaxID=53552 RepID=UPI00237D51A8|nr:uncharacterized protein LOC128745553 [Sabethes cyaneus]